MLKISLYDLLHGLMLPSGNDAAIMLSEIFGTILFYKSKEARYKILTNNEYYLECNKTIKTP